MRPLAPKHVIAVLLVILTVSINTAAEPMKVVRTNGLSLHGEVVKKGKFYEISTTAGQILIPENEVKSVEKYISFQQEYTRRVEQLKNDDHEARYRLANWCRGQMRFEQAIEQLETLIKLAPDNEKAKILLQLVKKQAEDAKNTPLQLHQENLKDLSGAKLASTADIQAIRRAELRGDDKVRVIFRNNVLKRFVDYMLTSEKYNQDDASRFYNDLRPVQKAIEMIDSLPGNEEIHRDIIIDSNPRTLASFKMRIWPLLASSCASGKCHGSPGASGKLKLIKTDNDSDSIIYTNILNITSYHNIDGWLIDRTKPERSLLLQYISPSENSKKKHPGGKVEMLEKFSKEDIELIENWIKQMMIPADGYKVPDFFKSTDKDNQGKPDVSKD